MWIGLCCNGKIIGPIFFDSNLNGELYLAMLNERMMLELQLFYGEGMNRVWWMQGLL